MKLIDICFYLLLITSSCLFAKEQEHLPDTSNASSQLTDSTEVVSISDTLRFKYIFYPGDTLIYKVTSHDSLIHNMDKPLMKSRVERLQVICDSIDFNRDFHLSIQLIRIEQKEWQNDKDTVIRSTSVWGKKKIRLIIDSLGNRKKSFIYDSSMISSSLGGAFQPYLFFSLGDTCKVLNSSWLSSSHDTLSENAYPPANINQTSLFRAKSKLIDSSDTLALLTFVKTAKGLYGFKTKDISVSVQNVMNVYGELTISYKNNIPRTLYITQEEKLHFVNEDGSKIPAWHFSITLFELESIIRNPKPIRIEIPKNNNKKKK